MSVGKIRKSGVPVEVTFRLRLSHWLRQHPDVSQRELDRNAEISHVHLQHVLKGWAEPSLKVAGRLAKAIGTTLADLI